MSGGGRFLAIFCGFVAMFLVAWVVFDLVFGRTPMQRRIAGLRVFSVGPQPEKEPLIAVLLGAGGRAVDKVELLRHLAARAAPLLDRAATRMRPSEWLAVRIAAGLGLGLPAGAVLGLLGFLIGLLVGFLASGTLLRVKVTRRDAQFADELPNTLQLVLSSLRSGFTLHQSIEAAVRDDDGPVAAELSRALSESRINGEFEDALARVGERVNSTEMNWLVMAIRLQREVGGSLADVMQTTADTMRERAYLRRHVRALSAEGRFSAWILVALPIGIGLLLYVTRPEYVSLLFTKPLGVAMLLGAAVMMVVGGVWLRATVKIEV
jgi:tight adherence protein B